MKLHQASIVPIENQPEAIFLQMREVQWTGIIGKTIPVHCFQDRYF
jgi:hypothetical protein